MADERLVLLSARPLNAETFLAAQVGVITPNARFYVRNHFDVPELDPASWGLSVTGLVDRPLRLSLADLRRLPSRSLVVTLECAGNGRARRTPAATRSPSAKSGIGLATRTMWCTW